MAKLSLVYLARLASGMASFRAFAESYRQHPAGIDHDLVVVYKGFPESRDEYRHMLEGVSYHETEVPDSGFDVGSYVAASRRLETKYVCFLNSFSETLAPDWLCMLFQQVVRPGVGAVGATGSWESFYTDYEIDSRRPDSDPAFYGWTRKAWRAWKLNRYRRDYLPAPNPHLRSNAFVIERTRLLSLTTGALRSKHDVWRFESGRKSMTYRLLSQGLDVLVVGRDGIAYTKDQWPESSTFRSGNQRNLLVADNRTRAYERADDTEKRRLAQLAWGNQPGSPPEIDC